MKYMLWMIGDGRDEPAPAEIEAMPEFIAWEECQDERYEFVGGVLSMGSGLVLGRDGRMPAARSRALPLHRALVLEGRQAADRPQPAGKRRGASQVT